MAWKPSNRPTGYDEERVENLEAVSAAIANLRPRMDAAHKLFGILNAIETQIEEGGDSPAVNSLLLDALRAAIRHLLGEAEGARALRAVDEFAAQEAEHWEEIRAGRYQAPPEQPIARLERLVYEGRDAADERDPIGASQKMLEAWEMVKETTTPDIRTLKAFDAAQDAPYLDSPYWVVDLQYELWNAGLQDPIYHEHRVRLNGEALALFPDSDDNMVVNLRRGQAESLWALGRRDEAEAIYADLIDRFPDDGYVYAGWADQFWMRPRNAEADYPRAEAILRRALERPNLEHRDVVLERLASVYREWGKPDEQAAAAAEAQAARLGRPAPAKPTVRQGPPPGKPGRNEPCWCGSGKKYKHCHMHADRLAES